MSKPKQSGTPLVQMTSAERKAMHEAQLSRRGFLQRSGGIAAVTVGASAASAGLADSAVVQDADEAPQTESPYEYTFRGVPNTPDEPPEQEFVAFSQEQAAIVEALTARILPGSPDDPGAREAGVVYYIDSNLSTNSGIHEATYTAGPYAQTYEGDTAPADDDEETIWVKADEISRYGYQAPLSPLQAYEIALPLVQEHARQKYGGPVHELSDEDQDQIIWDLLDEEIEGFDQFSPRAFFHLLRRHTSEGMFSDPAYGGNREMIGWKLVGFPGAQRAYAPEELVREDEPRAPQAMSELPHFQPGQTSHNDHDNVLQPVREGGDQDGE